MNEQLKKIIPGLLDSSSFFFKTMQVIYALNFSKENDEHESAIQASRMLMKKKSSKFLQKQERKYCSIKAESRGVRPQEKIQVLEKNVEITLKKAEAAGFDRI